jgi:hypothetical protein
MAVICHMYIFKVKYSMQHPLAVSFGMFRNMWHVADMLHLATVCNKPHVDGGKLLLHSNHAGTLMVLTFNMIHILKFIITVDHSDHSW